MDQDLQTRINKAAEFLLNRGWSVLPISVETKKPVTKWIQYIDKPMEFAEWTESFQGCNLGLITGECTGVVVVDCDSTKSCRGWLATKPLTPLRVRSKRGMHFYYRHPGGYVKSGSHIQDSAGFEYDVKGDRSYVMFPPSFRSGHQYQIMPCSGNIVGTVLDENTLPVFDVAWRPETKLSHSFEDKNVTDGVAYIAKIFAVEGSGGDKDTYRAACKLKESGLSETEALLVLLEWNKTNAKPPWAERDLYRKIKCAFDSGAVLQ